MGESFWRSEKQRASSRYQPRQSSQSLLYRIVYEFREDFEYQWEDLFQSRYEALRQVVLDTLDAFLNCGVFAHGCARICCEDCEHSELLAFSCKRRCFCPSCDAKRSHIFAEQVHSQILPQLPVRHIVWSIPKRIRPYFKFNRTLSTHLFHAAWQTWKEYCEQLLPNSRTGAVSAIHTAGSMLNHHPHLHGIHLDGGIDSDGKFQQLAEVDPSFFEYRFREILLCSLEREDVLLPEVVDNMKTWQHSGFHAHPGDPVEPEDNEKRLFLARYLLKCPISLKRMELVAPSTIRYYRDADDLNEFRDFSPMEFLAEAQQHIPDVWEQLIRYYGVASPRSRGKERKDKDKIILFQVPEEMLERKEPRRPVSRQWAIWIKKIYDFDPMVCPKCGATMKIKAFIFDMKEISRFTEHLGFPAWRAPPPIRNAAPA